MSIRTRLTLWYSGVLAVTLLLFGIGLYAFLNYSLYGNQSDQMNKLANKINSGVAWSVMYINGKPEFVPYMPQIEDISFYGYFIQIVDPNGYVLKQNDIRITLPLDQATITKANQNGGFYQKVTYKKIPLYIYNERMMTAAHRGGDQQFVGVLQIGVPVDDIEKILHGVLLFLIAITALILIIASTLGWYLSRKAFKPIHQVITAAGQIQEGADLGKRIEYDGPPDEIGSLTRTINRMLARIQIIYQELEESNRAQRRFVSDASHELRTPLTTIRGNVDLLAKMWRQEPGESTMSDADKRELSLDAMRDISGEAERMSRLVNDLLSLARADAGFTMAKEYVEMAPIVEDVVRNAAMLPRTAEWVAGDLTPLAGVQVLGNRDYLRQMLFIFIENAFKYTSEGFIRIDAVRTDSQVGISITDTGIGMDREDVPHIFDRFYRADPSRGQRSGTGLGLSIAKWIIDEHGGSIEVTTRKGSGSRFIVWLPFGFPPLAE